MIGFLPRGLCKQLLRKDPDKAFGFKACCSLGYCKRRAGFCYKELAMSGRVLGVGCRAKGVLTRKLETGCGKSLFATRVATLTIKITIITIIIIIIFIFNSSLRPRRS